jgi:hypothetical protein
VFGHKAVIDAALGVARAPIGQAFIAEFFQFFSTSATLHIGPHWLKVGVVPCLRQQLPRFLPCRRAPTADMVGFGYGFAAKLKPSFILYGLLNEPQ